ncbi:MAG: NAD(+) synthase [Bacteroidales bacterium]|nr:NAD(+) synthase [Bacteroidales bacterium]MBN2758156.1 NAD(+) synthase [Bacteroidales bacterium]
MIKDYKSAIENIRKELKIYIQTNNIKSLIAGISGGIDSALSIALAKPVCDELNIPLIGRSITIETNKADEISRAKFMGENFTSDFKEVNLTQGYKLISPFVVEKNLNEQENRAFKIRLGNIKARLRMIYLYDLASKHKGMVLSTDNYTELLLGFWTLHGDVGDYGMIQNLWKTEVYEMSRVLASDLENKNAQKALLDCVTAVATDGLGITNSDLDQIQAKTYEEVDEILIKLLKDENNLGKLANHPVIERKRNSEYKRNNPFNIPRNKITTVSYF